MNYSKLKKSVESSSLGITELFKKLNLSKSKFYYCLKRETMTVEFLEEICEKMNLNPIDYLEIEYTGAVNDPAGIYIAAKPDLLQKELIKALQELNECRKEKEILLQAKHK